MWALRGTLRGAITGLIRGNLTHIGPDYLPVATFTTFDAPADVVAAYQSDRYSMTVSQPGTELKDLFVFQNDNDNGTEVNPNTMDYMQVANHETKFRMDPGTPVTISITMLDATPINSVVIKPFELGIIPVINGDTVSFTLPDPHYFSVEINETYEKTATYGGIGEITKKISKHPILIYAAPTENDAPAQGAAGVTRYAPGIHSIGLNNPLPDGTHIYLDGWAVLVGGFATTQANPSNIKIHGNGVLTGKLTSSTSLTNTDDGWTDHAIALAALGQGSNGTNNVISGISIIAPMRSCIVSYNSIDLSWVSMTSWQHRRDGLTAGKNSSSSGEIFIKSQDDQCKVYYENQDHQAHFIIWQQTSGSPCKFGWNTSRDVYGVRFKKVTLIHCDVFYDIDHAEIDRQDLNSTSAFFSSMGYNENGRTSDVVYDEIIIEEPILRLIGLRLKTSHDGQNWGNPDADLIISGIQVNKLTMAYAPVCKPFVYANAGGSIGKLSLKNVTIAGELITAYDQLPSLNDGRGMILADDGLGGSVGEIIFSPRNMSKTSAAGAQYIDLGLSITADRIVMDVYPTSGNTGLPTGVPSVTNFQLQTLDFTLTEGAIQYIGRKGSDYFDGYILNVKIYNGATLLEDMPLDEDWTENLKARNRSAPVVFDSFTAPNSIAAPWVDNGDGTYSIDGSQTSNKNIYFQNVLVEGDNYLMIAKPENSTVGGIRPYNSDVTPSFSSGNVETEFAFTAGANLSINVQCSSDFDGEVEFVLKNVTNAPAYGTVVNVTEADAQSMDYDLDNARWLGPELITQSAWENPYLAQDQWSFADDKWTLTGDGNLSALRLVEQTLVPDFAVLTGSVDPLSGTLLANQGGIYANLEITTTGEYSFDFNKADNGNYEYKRSGGVVSATLSKPSLRECLEIAV